MRKCGKNIVERRRPQVTVWRMRFAFWIPRAIITRTGCLMLIAFPLQQCLHERASLLHYKYISCRVNVSLCLSQEFGNSTVFLLEQTSDHFI